MTLIYKNQILLYLLVFVLGLISSISLPPYNFFFLNFFSYPALLWILLINPKDKLKSFNIGWIFGFGYFFYDHSQSSAGIHESTFYQTL